MIWLLLTQFDMCICMSMCVYICMYVYVYVYVCMYFIQYNISSIPKKFSCFVFDIY
jgi:hypothetical protein